MSGSQQIQARVAMEDLKDDAHGNMAHEDRGRYQEPVKILPIFDRRAEDLIGRSFATGSGEDMGEVDFIGVRGQTRVAIIDVGGFLGMGENDVAVPVEKLIMRRNEPILPEFTQSLLGKMPEFNESEMHILELDVHLAEEFGLIEAPAEHISKVGQDSSSCGL